MPRNTACLAVLFATVSGCMDAEAQDLTIAGTWSQSSSGQELVLVPKIKLQPNVGIGYGTSLGGTTGFGSPTRTAIVTEPTLMDVERSMTLSVVADGRFNWTIIKRHAADGGCTRTTTQDKTGRVRLSGGQLVFAISGGTERWRSSCGGSGGAALAAIDEAYAVSVQGRSLRLESGPTRWSFTRN